MKKMPNPEGRNNEKDKSLSSFVENLVRNGVQPLKTPEHLNGRKFYATCRKIINPHKLNGKWGNFFAEGYIIDLFEEVPPDSNNFMPFAHRDIKINEFSGGKKASGNLSISRNLLKFCATRLPDKFKQVTEESDKIWGDNGVDIIDAEGKEEKDIDEDVLKKLREAKNIPSNQSWRRLGFGKLLIALELELLKQIRVKKLELPSLSDELRSIFEKVRSEVGEIMDISKIDGSSYQNFATPFIA